MPLQKLKLAVCYFYVVCLCNFCSCSFVLQMLFFIRQRSCNGIWKLPYECTLPSIDCVCNSVLQTNMRMEIDDHVDSSRRPGTCAVCDYGIVVVTAILSTYHGTFTFKRMKDLKDLVRSKGYSCKWIIYLYSMIVFLGVAMFVLIYSLNK